MNKQLALGIDIGGSHYKILLATNKGNIIKEKIFSLNRLEKSNIIFSQIINKIKKEFKDYLPKIKGIGIGLPGNIDTINGICFFSPNFPEFKNLNVINFFKKEIKTKIKILNDVTAAAYGELFFGKGKIYKNFVVVFLGTGIGGGIVIDKKVLSGANNGAGEIGHITIEPDGPLCDCGNRGCLEALASSKTIEKLAKKYFNINLTAKQVYNKAENNDPIAIKIFDIIGKNLGLGIANIVIILDPEKVIIGGGVSNAYKYFMPALLKELKSRIKMFKIKDNLIEISNLKEHAVALGAAAKILFEGE